LSAVFLALALITYNAMRLVVPIFVVAWIINYRKIIFKKENYKVIIISVITAFILLLPTISIINTDGFQSRLKATTIVTEKGNLVKVFAAMYSSYFSIRSLFNLGDDNPTMSYPDVAVFFGWMVPFYVVGLWLTWRLKNKKLKYLILSWLLISPIPAALTRNPLASIRALSMVVPLTLVMAVAIVEFGKKWRKTAIFLLSVVIIYLAARLWVSVFNLNDPLNYRFRSYGWNRVVTELNKIDGKMPVVVDSGNNDMPYIQILFFSKFDPVTFQKNNINLSKSEYYSSLVTGSDRKIGNIEVRGIVWKNDVMKKQILVGNDVAISDDQVKEHCLLEIFKINGPDGRLVIRGFETRPEYKTARGCAI
jgi:hypothetical protein